MNWGVRISLILVIVGGLVWLNWSRFSEEKLEHLVLDEKITQAEDTVVIQNSVAVEGEKYTQIAPTIANLEAKSSVAKTPEFELQPVPVSLNDSDAQVRLVATELSSDAAGWLQTEEQLRKWILLITQAAEGKVNHQDRPLSITLSEFIVDERDKRYFLSIRNYERYDTVVAILTHLPVDKLAAYHRAWYPMLEQAFAELGLPGSFDERLDTMLDRILSVELIDRPIELKKPTSVTYKFMDPELESASQIEKCLWRMGPENARKIQDLAERLKQALGTY